MARSSLLEADRSHIEDIIERYTPIIKAAGMWSPALNAGNIFMLGGAIIQDEKVAARASAYREGAVVPDGSTLKALAAMTPREIDTLQTRIMDKYKSNVRKG